MEAEGGCYCGAVRYKVSGNPLFQGQCHCRECQYISGGSPNVTIGVPADAFSWTKGKPKGFARTDLENPVTREFCENCGTHLTARPPGMGGAALLKVGTLDDPSVFTPQMAIYTCDKQSFHGIPEGIPTFDRMPG